MSLNCLACPTLQRTNSDKEFTHNIDKEHYRKMCCLRVDRSWSGNLASPPYEQMRNNGASQSLQLVPPAKKVKKSCRRLNSTSAMAFEGNSEPKLVRSVGMRRDWSFEDLRQQRNENRKSGRLS